jgi:RimJ/RimL family protein N-acetyltransferase
MAMSSWRSGVAPEFNGRGFSGEAVRALAQWALAQSARCVVVHCDAEDLGIAQVLKKSGFADTNQPPYPGVARWALAAA